MRRHKQGLRFAVTEVPISAYLSAPGFPAAEALFASAADGSRRMAASAGVSRSRARARKSASVCRVAAANTSGDNLLSLSCLSSPVGWMRRSRYPPHARGQGIDMSEVARRERVLLASRRGLSREALSMRLAAQRPLTPDE